MHPELRIAGPLSAKARDGRKLPVSQAKPFPSIDVPEGELHDVPANIGRDA